MLLTETISHSALVFTDQSRKTVNKLLLFVRGTHPNDKGQHSLRVGLCGHRTPVSRQTLNTLVSEGSASPVLPLRPLPLPFQEQGSSVSSQNVFILQSHFPYRKHGILNPHSPRNYPAPVCSNPDPAFPQTQEKHMSRVEPNRDFLLQALLKQGNGVD